MAPMFAAAIAMQAEMIADKTLVAWARPSTLDQRGGSLLSLDDRGTFDGIVFGELAERRWMPGSDFYRRTPRNQDAWPAETGGWVQIAIVYRGRQVSIFRNGEPYASAQVESAAAFGLGTGAVFGLRHMEAGDRACFQGEIDDARVYGQALDGDTLKRLRPNAVAGGPEPLAWWDFERGSTRDRMGRFPAGKLMGNAKIVKGVLSLGPGFGAMAAIPPRRVMREPRDWPIYHLHARPSEGIALPYDANGAIYWKGKYHLMYIFQDPVLGHCWGHVSSTDLVNWMFHPPALVPNPGDPDKGIFSGNAFVNREGKPMLCWFGIDAGVCVATAEDDDLIRWKKHPNNPIVPLSKEFTVWDPYLWLDGNRYKVLLGGNRLPNGKDTLFAMESPDLIRWKPVGPFYEHPDLTWTRTEEDNSCPDFFRLGDKWVLLCISHNIGSRAYVGAYDGTRFHPERHVRMNWPGGVFFAPESMEDGKGRRIFWGWVMDPRIRPTQRISGSGTMSLPRVMELGGPLGLQITPAPELQALRGRRFVQPAGPLDGEMRFRTIQGLRLEIAAKIEVGSAEEVGLKVRQTPDGSEETAIVWSPKQGELRVELGKSSLRTDLAYGDSPFVAYNIDRAEDNPHPVRTIVCPLPASAVLDLRVFIDGPVLEVFANGQCVTAQVFPQSEAATSVSAFARGGRARLLSAEAWTMRAARFKER